MKIRLYPTWVDRLFEGAAVVVLLSIWGCVLWTNLHVADGVLGRSQYNLLGMATVVMLLLGGSAYLPITYYNFPVRITERNAAIQYLLASRFCRILNILVGVLFLAMVLGGIGVVQNIASISSIVLTVVILLSIVVFFIIAYRYRDT